MSPKIFTLIKEKEITKEQVMMVLKGFRSEERR